MGNLHARIKSKVHANYVSSQVTCVFTLSPLGAVLNLDHYAQVLGRNLEALVTRAQQLKSDWKDKYVSVEHLVLAFLDDPRFGQRVFQTEGLTKAKLEAAIKDIRGNNQVTDQVGLCSTLTMPENTVFLSQFPIPPIPDQLLS